MNFAEEIKERVSIIQLAQNYGFKPNNKGFISCPFHNEKTASLKLYENNSFYCFGCAKAGDSITFVMKCFSINFQQAIIKINDDFHLMLPIGYKPTLQERKKMMEDERKRKQEKKEKQDEKERLENNHTIAVKYYHKLQSDLITYAPTSSKDIVKNKFLKAVQNISYAEYLVDCAYIERCDNGR